MVKICAFGSAKLEDGERSPYIASRIFWEELQGMLKLCVVSARRQHRDALTSLTVGLVGLSRLFIRLVFCFGVHAY